MRRKGKLLDNSLLTITYGASLLVLITLVLLVGYIVINGVPNLKPSLFEWEYNSSNVSMMPSIITTLQMTVISLAIALPFGISAAIYLVEYASKKNKVVGLIRLTTETLSGIPSIIYGLFGLLFFVTFLKWGFSLISGSLTLSIMILPLIMRTTEEALKSVPDSFREGSFGLGAGKIRTIFRIILPSAMSGILAGVILSIGRIVGETAALIYTAGTMTKIPASIFDSGRTLSVHMYVLSSEGLHTKEAFATAFVLLVFIILINTGAGFLAKRIKKD